jgi:methyl-accepting chemotaxis protein
VSATERLLGALSRVLPGRKAEAGHTSLDDAFLFRSHERARTAAEQAMSACQAVGAGAAQQKGALDAAVDAVRNLLSRGRDTRGSLEQARDSLDRIRIVALNAGLEGARLGDPAGKPLMLVAEEVNGHVARGVAAIEDHATTLSLLERDREKLGADLGLAQQRAADLARELLAAQAAQKDAQSALADVGDRIKSVTRTDPETARAVTEAADHARALVAALSQLSSKPHRASLLGALTPSLGPLFELLREVLRGSVDLEPP